MKPIPKPRPSSLLRPESLVFLGIIVLRLIVLVRLADSQFLLPQSGDMQFYNNWALRILHGQWTTHTAFYGLPLYAYLLAAIYKVVGYNPFFPGFLQAVLDGGTGVVLYWLGTNLFNTKDETTSASKHSKRGVAIGILAATGWALFQPAQAYSVILMPTAWLVFVFWFVVAQVMKRRQSPTVTLCLITGALLGFTAMGIATILFLVPFLIAALFLRWPATFSHRASGAALIMAGVLAGASPAWTHNYVVAHDPVFLSAHSGINFWIGNNPEANGYPKFPPGLHAGQEAMLQDSITEAEREKGKPLMRSEVSSFWSAKARAWISQHPSAWLHLLGIKLKDFWNAFQYDDISVISALRDEGVIVPGMSFGLIAALALPGMLLAVRRVPASRWIMAAVLLHMASLLTVFVTERYRLAAVPGLLLFAAYGLVELWSNLTSVRLREAGLFLFLLFAATAFVGMPQKDASLWALDSYNSGLHALDAGHLSLAREKLDHAYSYSPSNAEINFAEGNLHLALGETNEAKRFYFDTLRLDPNHSGAYNNLGVLALTENRSQLAVRLFQLSMRDKTQNAKSYFLLAQAEFKSGDYLAARRAMTRAMEIDPSPREFRVLQDQLARVKPNGIGVPDNTQTSAAGIKAAKSRD